MSQLTFSSQIGMARTYFAEVETGKRNVSARNLVKITNGLGVTLAEFFDSDIFEPLYRPPKQTSWPERISHAYISLPLLEEDD